MNDTEFVVILGHFLSLDPPNNLKNQILKKWKKCPEILSFYICVPQMTIMWYMVPDIWSTTDWIFCHLDYSLPFYPPNTENQNFEKMKKLPEDIIILHMCTINEKSWCIVPEIWAREKKTPGDIIILIMACSRCNSFVSFWAIIYPFTPLKSPKKSKFEKKRKKKKKKKKKIPEISFHTCVPKIMIRWCTVPEMWCETEG